MINESPAALPPNVLERADVRDALLRRDFGEVFTLAKKYGGISFLKIADAISVKPQRIGQVARGQAMITSFEKIAEISDGLRIPGHMLGLAPRAWEGESTPSNRVALRDVDRPVIVIPAFGPWEVAELARQVNSTDISNAELETINLAIDQLCRAYPYMPADRLHQQTRTGISHVTALMNRRTTLKQHRELLVSAGWLFLLGGCLEYDMGHKEAADISRATALRIGKETGHSEIVAWSFELGAWFALTQGQYSSMLECVESGHRADSTHSVGVQLYAHAAKAYARIGNVRESRDALDAGRARLERLPRPEHKEHHFVIDPDKWDFYEMDTYRMLGDDTRAATHAEEVIRLGRAPDGTEIAPMRVAEARLTLAVGAARSGELEAAVNIGERALTTPRKSLPSLLLVAGDLNDELAHRYPKEPLAREFRRNVQELAAGSRPTLESP